MCKQGPFFWKKKAPQKNFTFLIRGQYKLHSFLFISDGRFLQWALMKKFIELDKQVNPF